jgi:hypothetical protein
MSQPERQPKITLVRVNEKGIRVNEKQPKTGDEIILEGVRITVADILKNTNGDPIVRWTSKFEEGVCMISIWEEWVRCAKLGDPLTKKRRSD